MTAQERYDDPQVAEDLDELRREFPYRTKREWEAAALEDQAEREHTGVGF